MKIKKNNTCSYLKNTVLVMFNEFDSKRREKNHGTTSNWKAAQQRKLSTKQNPFTISEFGISLPMQGHNKTFSFHT